MARRAYCRARSSVSASASVSLRRQVAWPRSSSDVRSPPIALACRDHRRRVAEDLEHAQGPVLDHQLECTAEQKIADEDAGRIAPDEVGRALAPAHPGAVDDIVVKQGRGVDELDRRRELV